LGNEVWELIYYTVKEVDRSDDLGFSHKNLEIIMSGLACPPQGHLEASGPTPLSIGQNRSHRGHRCITNGRALMTPLSEGISPHLSLLRRYQQILCPHRDHIHGSEDLLMMADDKVYAIFCFLFRLPTEKCYNFRKYQS
jgi:hypothetical protein